MLQPNGHAALCRRFSLWLCVAGFRRLCPFPLPEKQPDFHDGAVRLRFRILSFATPAFAGFAFNAFSFCFCQYKNE